MNNLYLETVTFDGLHYKRTGKGGGYSAPSPCSIEPDAYGASFDKDTLTLTWLIPNPPIGEVGQEPSLASYTFTEEEIEAGKVFVTTPRPAVIPDRVSKAQFKLAILGAGIDMDALIGTLDPADQPVARVLYNNADYFTRTAAMVAKLGSKADLTTEQLDDLFRAAAQIDPNKI